MRAESHGEVDHSPTLGADSLYRRGQHEVDRTGDRVGVVDERENASDEPQNKTDDEPAEKAHQADDREYQDQRPEYGMAFGSEVDEDPEGDDEGTEEDPHQSGDEERLAEAVEEQRVHRCPHESFGNPAKYDEHPAEDGEYHRLQRSRRADGPGNGGPVGGPPGGGTRRLSRVRRPPGIRRR